MNWFLFCGVFAFLRVGVIGTPTGAVSQFVDPAKENDNKIVSDNFTSNSSEYDTWVPPGRLKQWMPWFVVGKDNDGAPVHVIPAGKWNFRKATTQGTKEEIGSIEKYINQIVDSFSRDAEMGSTGGAVLIFDFDGFVLSTYAHHEGDSNIKNALTGPVKSRNTSNALYSISAVRALLMVFTKIGKVYKVLDHGYVVNTNFAAELFINSARPLMGSLMERMDIYGTRREKWIPKLLQRIPKEVLPLKFGGQNKKLYF